MLLGEAEFGNENHLYGGRLTPGCGNLMVERTVFDEVGRFERTVDGRGEDTDLFSRIEKAGIAAWYIPTAVVLHLTPPERLASEYLLSLSHRMGEGIALRQRSAGSRGRFALLVAAKAVRLTLWQAPVAIAALVCGNREAWLGGRCLLAINSRFVSRGTRLLWPQGTPLTRTTPATPPGHIAAPAGASLLTPTSAHKI